MDKMFKTLESRINLFLDDALSKDEESALISDIKKSPECCKKLAEEQQFRSFVKSNFYKRACCNDLKERIKSEIKGNEYPS